MDLPEEYVGPFERRGFTLVAPIGSGLSGRVFRATQKTLERDVAIKVFDNPLNDKNTALQKRFLREAQLLARIVHPSIPTVLTRGELSISGKELLYTVLQFIDGQGLDVIIERESKVELSRAVGISTKVLGALAAAHAKQIIHRDVKPANIMVQPALGHVYLIDFSIGVSLAPAPGLTRVTQDGGHPGSFEYMAPEQEAGRDVDQRADLYAMGIVLFEMLTGHRQVRPTMIDADLAHVPADVRAIIRKACEPNPKDRFENAEAFQRALMPFGTAFRAREQPGTALCLNPKCPWARWKEHGYYAGPRVIENTTDNCCEQCGANLVYPCEQCGRPYASSPFCGNCGHKHYDVPVCKQCGSWLKAEDMDADTAANGCDKCRPKQAAPPVDFSTGADDDIPF